MISFFFRDFIALNMCHKMSVFHIVCVLKRLPLCGVIVVGIFFFSTFHSELIVSNKLDDLHIFRRNRSIHFYMNHYHSHFPRNNDHAHAEYNKSTQFSCLCSNGHTHTHQNSTIYAANMYAFIN